MLATQVENLPRGGGGGFSLYPVCRCATGEGEFEKKGQISHLYTKIREELPPRGPTICPQPPQELSSDSGVD